ncbi:MAG: hypothetical protein H6884_06330 [Rhodobiaceae bacterium]|nr:hypothetical protein [Rhodobiaceae bacterium]MCC0040833.1 hypothetical protein [Rhodobiaceae bacterium]MCC0053659.1 hypothetical protein [Rhodobiaceae bacterium]
MSSIIRPLAFTHFRLSIAIVLVAVTLGLVSGTAVGTASAQAVVQPTCPPGYQLMNGLCHAVAPAPSCPAGYVFSNGQCIAAGGQGNASANLVWDLQTELKRIGCLYGSVDGVWGNGSRAALGRFAQLTGLALGTEPSQNALNAAMQTATGSCSANIAPPNPPSGNAGSGDWYAIALSTTSRNAAQAKANALGPGWFVMNTNQCPNFRNGYWIATAGGFSKNTAQLYVNQAGGDAYRKRCH